MDVIIVFPKMENGERIKRILQQNGFTVRAVCTTGAKALQCAHGLSGGIVVCGYRFSDMAYSELYEYLPPGFEMLLAASADHCDSRECEDIVCIRMPFRVHELLQTMHMMAASVSGMGRRQKRNVRSEEEKILLRDAKELLMSRNGMTEEEAHRYLQKRSMDNGIGIVETAQMVLSLMVEG